MNDLEPIASNWAAPPAFLWIFFGAILFLLVAAFTAAGRKP